MTYLGKNPNHPTGYQVYELEIRQPVNHHNPHGATFEQHLELYQRDVTAPMVMFFSGYFNYTFLGPQEHLSVDPGRDHRANQISVEHRFYGDSVPHPALWRYLTIWQQAADEHHVEQVFKKLYQARWLITGVSKGGETAIFHDYFYPHDFSGTFAWSAPSITRRPAAATTISSPAWAPPAAGPRCWGPDPGAASPGRPRGHDGRRGQGRERHV